jgi:hypothetical protein
MFAVFRLADPVARVPAAAFAEADLLIASGPIQGPR